MNPCDPALNPLLDELLSILDDELALLDRRRDQLHQLFEVVMAREYIRLGGLLEGVEAIQRDQAGVDIRLAAARRNLARRLGCDEQNLRLSEVIDLVGGRKGARIELRREQIIAQAEKIRKDNWQVATMLGECTKINRSMLEAIFPHKTRVTTYGSRGSKTWQSSQSLVDSER